MVAGAVAIALSGTAMANTSLSTTDIGDLFLNIVQYTVTGPTTESSTSYLFDTGLSETTFNPSASYTFTLTTDPNITGFTGAATNLDYSVIAAVQSGHSYTDFFTGSLPVASPLTASSVSAAGGAVKTFITGADAVTSSTTNSASLGAAATWGQGLVEGVLSNNLFNFGNAPWADNAAVNTPIQFYGAAGATLSTYGMWDLTFNSQTGAELLTYSPSSTTTPPPPPPPVPLPTSIVLLLSGLGLFQIVGRREKALKAPSL
jgi:hypothetical protein